MTAASTQPQQPDYRLDAFDARCPCCGYNVRGTVRLSGVTCSECGTATGFDQLRFGPPSGLVTLKQLAQRSSDVHAGAAPVVVVSAILWHISSPAGHPLALLGGCAVAGIALAMCIGRIGNYRPEALLIAQIALVLTFALCTVTVLATSQELVLLGCVLMALWWRRPLLYLARACLPGPRDAAAPILTGRP